jgi:hypothetical protein
VLVLVLVLVRVIVIDNRSRILVSNSVALLNRFKYRPKCLVLGLYRFLMGLLSSLYCFGVFWILVISRISAKMAVHGL